MTNGKYQFYLLSLFQDGGTFKVIEKVKSHGVIHISWLKV